MTASPSLPPLAVTIDLDDTLFPQRDFLDGAWRAVAAAGARYGADEASLLVALREIAAEGSDRGQIIDRALRRCPVPVPAPGPGRGPAVMLPELVDAFRSHRPARLTAYPGVVRALARLRAVVPVALVTDGDPAIQRAKLAALGLAQAFDATVISDELGREFRKPNPAPFLAALEVIGVLPSRAVHVGDRPDKDVAGPHEVGMAAIRVRTGEYATTPDGEPRPDLTFPDAAAALDAIRVSVQPARGTVARSRPAGSLRPAPAAFQRPAPVLPPPATRRREC